MDFSNIAAALRKREYDVSCFKAAKEAAAYLDAAIDGQTVGFGDSMTLLTLGIYDLLKSHNDVRDPEHPREGEDFYSTARQCLLTDVFLTSVNGLAATGEMVNIDGTGNRVAGSLYGHKKVYFVIGSKKRSFAPATSPRRRTPRATATRRPARTSRITATTATTRAASATRRSSTGRR